MVTLWLGPTAAQADRLFTGDDWGNNLYEIDATVGEPSKVVFCGQTHGVNGLGADGRGNLLESDFGTRTIWKFTADGQHTVFAGLDAPCAATGVDAAGNVYVPYQGLGGRSGRIDKFSPDGGTHTILATNVPQPVQVIFDLQGEMFVSDQKSGCLYKFDPRDGSRTTFATGLVSPIGLAFDTNGGLYVADPPRGRIYRYTMDGHRTIFGRNLRSPCSLAFDSRNNLFMTDGGGSVFEFTNQAGKLSRQPTLLAKNLGHNYFMTILPGAMSAVNASAVLAAPAADVASQDLVADKILNATNSPDENELRRELVGTWRMAANESWGATHYHYYPEDYGDFKIFTPTDWRVVMYDAQSNLLYSAGGTYTLRGNVYNESIDTATGVTTRFLGNHPRFKILVDGDRYYQMGLDGNPPAIKEMWQRVRP